MSAKIHNLTYVTTMIDESREISALGRVYYGVYVDSEQIRTSDAGRLVIHLPNVGDYRPHHLPNIFNHHFVGGNRLHGEKTPIVNARFGELQLFLSELQLVEFEQVGIGVSSESREQSPLVRSSFPREALHFR